MRIRGATAFLRRFPLLDFGELSRAVRRERVEGEGLVLVEKFDGESV